jgi:hypothetical protein
MRPPFRRAYSLAIVTAALFLLSWTGQFSAQLLTVRNEADQHQQPFEWGDFLVQFTSSTLENWQSEFLQLVWLAAGLSLLLFWGSSQSKNSTRMSASKQSWMRCWPNAESTTRRSRDRSTSRRPDSSQRAIRQTRRVCRIDPYGRWGTPAERRALD